jgi:GNAT superfamily N-acetyltransferase
VNSASASSTSNEVIELREVKGRAQLRQYIYLPRSIYRSYPNWVPPIYADEWKFHNPRHNPALQESESIRVLALAGNEPVGRVMGIINRSYGQDRSEPTARFFQLDCVNDAAVALALLRFVEEWAAGRGMKKLIGPFGFSDKDPQGLQTDGFEHLPVISAPSNPPFLPPLVEAAGYEKEIDCVSYQIVLPEVTPPLLERIYRRVSKNPNLKLLEFSSKREMKPYIIPALQLVNETFTEIFGFTAMTDQEMEKLTAQYLPVVDPEFVKMVKNEKDQLAGFILAIPDISRGIKKAKGKLFPFGFRHILSELKKSQQLDMLLGAIRPGLRGLGIDVILGRAVIKSAVKRGMKTMDSHLIMETNRQMRAEYEKWGGTVYKQFRVYRKTLS